MDHHPAFPKLMQGPPRGSLHRAGREEILAAAGRARDRVVQILSSSRKARTEPKAALADELAAAVRRESCPPPKRSET